MTYAAEWNKRNRMKLPDGPTLTILSGEWDSHVEVIDIMDVDEDDRVLQSVEPEFVLSEVQRGRVNSRFEGSRRGAVSEVVRNWDDAVAKEQDMDWSSDGGVNARLVVVDTNVLISYLPLVQSFATYLRAHPIVPVKILVPGIVVHELDGLSKSSRAEVNDSARFATRWLLEDLRRASDGDSGAVRGQKDFETNLGASWRMAQSKILNDDLILDCCRYFAEGNYTVLLSSDSNLCVKCEAHGITSITPKVNSTRRQLLNSLGLPVDPHGEASRSHSYSQASFEPRPQLPMPNTLSDPRYNSVEAHGPIVRTMPIESPINVKQSTSTGQGPTSMDVDDEVVPSASLPGDVDRLVHCHLVLVKWMTETLPSRVEEAIKFRREGDSTFVPRDFNRMDKSYGVYVVTCPAPGDQRWMHWPLQKSLYFLARYYPVHGKHKPLAFAVHPFVQFAAFLGASSKSSLLKRRVEWDNAVQALTMLRYSESEVESMKQVAYKELEDNDV